MLRHRSENLCCGSIMIVTICLSWRRIAVISVLVTYLVDDAISQGLSAIQPLLDNYLDHYFKTSFRDQRSENYFVGRDSRPVDIFAA